MIEEGVITGVDARPGTAGRGGQAGLARGLRRPAATDLPRTPDWPSGTGRTLRLAFRGPAMASAVTACAWRLLTGTGYTPGPPPGTDTVHGAPGPGHPPPARRRPPCHTDRAAASRSPRSPPASRPATRTRMPESPLASHTAASPHGRPGRAPDLRTPGRPRPPCTPGHRTARVTTAISAPPVPGPDGMHARLSGGRRATDGLPGQPVRGRPWKGRRCTPTVLAAGRRPLTCIAAVTQMVPQWPHLRFSGVLHCAPLP